MNGNLMFLHVVFNFLQNNEALCTQVVRRWLGGHVLPPFVSGPSASGHRGRVSVVFDCCFIGFP